MRTASSRRPFSLAAVAVLLAVGSPAGGQAPTEAGEPPPAAVLERADLPAAGRQQTLLTVSLPGRYAITVESRHGTALTLIDRMAGPGETAGRPGGEDGRLDLFLDRGEYLVVTRGAVRASGAARLSVRPFREIRPSAQDGPVQLVDLKLVTAELGDLEQISYWLHLPEVRRVIVEAAGRHLADLRLWRDGAWLVDAAPQTQAIGPRPGRPLRLCRLTAWLPAGLYRLTAYGGPSQPWSEDSGQRPLYLRSGIPEAAEAGRRALAVSPFGFDHFLVPGSATYFRLELPEARAAELTVGRYQEDDPFAAGRGKASIRKESVPPVGELQLGPERGARRIVTVSGEAGQPYTLQHFAAQQRPSFGGEGLSWISTVHSGHPADSVDATAILVRHSVVGSKALRLVAAQAVELGPEETWSRRFNLLAPATLHLHVVATGSYQLLARGVEADFRVEPFFTVPPERYEPPPFRPSGSTWELDAGYYVLTVEPLEKGVVEVVARPRGWLDPVLETVGLGSEAPAEAVLGSVRFDPLHLDSGRTYTLYLNQQPEVKAGIVLRPLPMDLRRALPLTQRPGEEVEVPFTAPEGGWVRAVTEGGRHLDVSVDGAAWSGEGRAEAGEHRVRVRHSGEGTVVYSLELAVDSLAATSPLPPLPPGALTDLPDFPTLTPATPRYLDMGRGEARTFLLRADEPALYRLESTGLLATEGNLRSRVIPSLVRNAGDGDGRNFLIQRYLRRGDYQVTVRTAGQSRGHLGLRLRRTRVRDGGWLATGGAARGTLPVGSAVAYRLRVDEAGTYRLRSVGAGRFLEARIEDADGWPLGAPVAKADQTLRLEPGEYRVFVLPQPVTVRQVTVFERVPAPLRFVGHGPHSLPLSREVEHLWLEPDDGAGEGGERPPDVWRFSLPAPVDATIALSDEMHGEIWRRGAGGEREKAAYVPSRRGWQGRLAAGDYELHARCVRTNNRVTYRLSVSPRQLVAGQTRQVEVPGEVPVAVGEAALVELASFGADDVRARLFDAADELVVAADDRPDDWNFLLSERLAAGEYRLRVDPVGEARGTTTVSMRLPEERIEDALALPARRSLELGDAVHVFPLELPAAADFVAVAAHSTENVGLSLEVAEGRGWRTVGRRVGPAVGLEMGLPAPGAEGVERRYRLRLWSLDRRGNPLQLTAVAGRAQRLSEGELAAGLTLRPVPDLEPATAVVAVELPRPGCFTAAAGGAPLRSAPRRGRVAEEAGAVMPALDDELWLVVDLSAPGRRRLAGERFFLGTVRAEDLLLRVPAGERVRCDLVPGSGPMLLRARSVAGQPGASLEDLSQPAAGAELHRRMAVAPNAALGAVLTSQDPAFAVWSAAGEAREVQLRGWAFPHREAERLTWGSTEGELEGTTTRLFVLPPGGKQVRLMLGPGSAAVLSRDGEPRSIHWAREGHREEWMASDADRLDLFHLAAGAAAFRLEVVPAGVGGGLAPPSPDRPFERRVARAGTLRLELPSAARREDGDATAQQHPAPPECPRAGASPLTLRVRGAEEVVLVGADGAVARGPDLAAPACGGSLMLTHRPGFLLAWLEDGATASSGPWGEGEPVPEELVSPPAVVSLSGRRQRLALEGLGPVVLHLRSATPTLTRLERAGLAALVEVHPEATSLDAFLPEGEAKLALRSLGSAELGGTAEITLSPVVPLGEGLGPEVLMGSGESRLFSFTLEHPGAVGLGVRAEADVVEAVLRTEAGEVVGRGAAQLHDLEPGRYLFTLTLPATSPPVRVRPAVVGLERPGTGPPAETIHSYLQREAAAEAARAEEGGQP